MRSILILLLVPRCIETIDVCMYMAHVYVYVCCSDCGKVCCVVTVVEESGLIL